jgi:hypothetical protein
MEHVFLIFESKIMSGKEKPPMIRICPFKEKEKEGGEGRSQFVANGRFHCLVANGRRRRGTFSLLPTFPPINFT